MPSSARASLQIRRSQAVGSVGQRTQRIREFGLRVKKKDLSSREKKKVKLKERPRTKSHDQLSSAPYEQVSSFSCCTESFSTRTSSVSDLLMWQASSIVLESKSSNKFYDEKIRELWSLKSKFANANVLSLDLKINLESIKTY